MGEVLHVHGDSDAAILAQSAAIDGDLAADRPLDALAKFEQGTRVQSTLKSELVRRYGPQMAYVIGGRGIEDDPGLRKLSKLYVEGRRGEQKLLVAATVDQIVAIGLTAAASAASPANQSLRRIGTTFESLVLEGTLQQQLCCKLAIRFGVKRPVEFQSPLIVHVINPLIEALKVVLRVGAPTTRDSAVEGLGALLKLVDAEKAFPCEEAPESERSQGDPKLNQRYAARLERRRGLVLAVAGHHESLRHVRSILEEPLAKHLAEIRKVDRNPKETVEEIERAIYEQADLLRTLPAITRQSSDENRPWIELLRTAAGVVAIDDDREPRIQIAFARYQESVFRTIDVMVRRDRNWQFFDRVVADAVEAIPRTFVGRAPVANGQVRATVAIIRTAVKLVLQSDGTSATKTVLRRLFEEVPRPVRWANLGIAEGCYRGLPHLAFSIAHADLARTALRSLLDDLRRRDPDFVSIHRRLIAGSCFRSILLRLSEQKDSRRIRMLLHNPAAILRAAVDDVPADVSDLVIESVAFEKELFTRMTAMLTGWDGLTDVEEVLLTRILAVQLHTFSRQTRELEKCPELAHVFATMPTHEQTYEQRNILMFDLLSALPAGAAAAADSDLHRFVERCGRMRIAPAEEHVEDLPGYALAMISPNVSSRLADAVAREIDLSLRQARHQKKHQPDRPVDFAKSLYQAMLRGPHEKIFQHLLPRLADSHDRRIADFFCRHIAAVRRICEEVRDESRLLDALLEHVAGVVEELDGTRSETLRRMRVALALYQTLATNSEGLWNAITRGDPGGGLGLLLRLLDDLAQFAHVRNLSTDQKDSTGTVHRKPLEPAYRDRLVRVQNGIAQYLKLSIRDFAGRAAALGGARDAALDVERSLASEPGLQPPERVLLTALVRRLREIFQRTIFWYCDEPRRFMEANGTEDKQTFWDIFTSDPAKWQTRVEEVEKGLENLDRTILDRHAELLSKLQSEYPLAFQILRLRAAAGNEPPQITGQRDQFEECYMEWVSGDLDVDAIRRAVGERWTWFGPVFKTMTNLLSASLLILVPCTWAIVMDALEIHWLEGAGFIIVAAALVGAAATAFSVVLNRVASVVRRCVAWVRRLFQPDWMPKERLRQYWFQAVLPRLARLIAVPMVLTVEFDHSYKFPISGSSWVLFLLMVLSFFTTRFIVGREILPHAHIEELSPADRTRVRQIVAVALSHAFAIALLFSMLFATSHLHSESAEELPKQEKPAAITQAEDADAIWPVRMIASALRKADEVPPKPHERPRFLGVLPREVSFSGGEIARRLGFPLPRVIVEHSNFMFYPTIILTWTAMGLFFGVFLEGFLNGERLRADKDASSPARR